MELNVLLLFVGNSKAFQFKPTRLTILNLFNFSDLLSGKARVLRGRKQISVPTFLGKRMVTIG